MNYFTSRDVIRREETASKALGVQITRRRYLIVSTLINSPAMSIWEAIDAVAAIAARHPDWNMEETKTWAWWLKAPAGIDDVSSACISVFDQKTFSSA